MESSTWEDRGVGEKAFWEDEAQRVLEVTFLVGCGSFATWVLEQLMMLPEIWGMICSANQ